MEIYYIFALIFLAEELSQVMQKYSLFLVKVNERTLHSTNKNMFEHVWTCMIDLHLRH